MSGSDKKAKEKTMVFRAVIVLVLAVGVASCASKPATQPTADTARMPEQAAPPVAQQSSSYMQVPGATASGPLPPLEANRKINEQDCTKEVDLNAGNLRCK
jgi:hypothetical protein